MISEFLVYLRLGFEHIADPRGYDHILFLVALTAAHAPREWLRLLVLVTAFTVGHTITLVLATLDLIRIPGDLVEFLIPLTIVATAALDIAEVAWGRRHAPPVATATPVSPIEPPAGRRARYALALVFGLVHGLGFSSFLRAALGGEASLAVPLLGFNVGLEVGQVAIVAALMALAWLATSLLRIRRAHWTLFLSILAAAVATTLAVARFPA